MNIDLFGNVIQEEEEFVVEKPKAPSPFSYSNNIGDKKYPDTLEGYNPFLLNLSFSQRKDSVVFANEMNKYHELSDKAQFDFFFHSMPKRKYFAKWAKGVKHENTEAVSEYYKVSKKTAIEYQKVLKPEQEQQIVDWFETRQGGK